MNTRKVLYTIFAASAIFFGCTAISVDYEPTPQGDQVDVLLQSGYQLTGEFISIDDTSAYIIATQGDGGQIPALSHDDLVCIPLRTAKWISVNGYSDRSWILPVVVLQVLPAVLMGIAAERYNGHGEAYFGITLIPALVTAALFEVSTPRAPEAQWPFPIPELQNIRKYARFPAGMPSGAVEALLAQYNKRSMRTIEE